VKAHINKLPCSRLFVQRCTTSEKMALNRGRHKSPITSNNAPHERSAAGTRALHILCFWRSFQSAWFSAGWCLRGVLLLRGLTCFTKFRLGWRPRRVSKRDTEAMRKSLVSEEISRISIAPISEANSLEQMIGAFEAQLIWQCVPIIRRALVSCETNLKWVRRFRQVIITVNFVSSPRYPSKVYAG
jgi:hypothetical protein